MNLWLRAIGRVALFWLAAAALSGALLGGGTLLLLAMWDYPTYFWGGLFAIGGVVMLGAMVKSEHNRLAQDDESVQPLPAPRTPLP